MQHAQWKKSMKTMDKLIPNGPNVIHNIVPNKTNSQYVRVAQKGLF